MNFSEFYDQVYGHDVHRDGPSAYIQWKGSDVCVGLVCACGHADHVDSDFFYHYKCAKCGKAYSLSPNIKLIPLNDEQAAFIEGGGHVEFRTGDGGDE